MVNDSDERRGRDCLLGSAAVWCLPDRQQSQASDQGGSFDDADDALQETLVAAWRGLPAFQAKAPVRTWLYRIATNTCLNLVRSAARRPQMTQPLPAAVPVPTGIPPVIRSPCLVTG